MGSSPGNYPVQPWQLVHYSTCNCCIMARATGALWHVQLVHYDTWNCCIMARATSALWHLELLHATNCSECNMSAGYTRLVNVPSQYRLSRQA